MKRRTVDVIAGSAAIGLAGLLLAIGLVMTSNAAFAKDYVASQLGQQGITFKQVEQLTPEERDARCLVRYAGQRLTTGKQAECYANEFIGLHLKSIGGGKTYAELGQDQADLRDRIAEARPAGGPALADLEKRLAELTAQRETVFQGETLRGLLLTSYGFSELGAKAEQAALVSYLGAAALALLSLIAFAHAARTPATVPFAPPLRAPERAGSTLPG